MTAVPEEEYCDSFSRKYLSDLTSNCKRSELFHLWVEYVIRNSSYLGTYSAKISLFGTVQVAGWYLRQLNVYHEQED